MSTGFKLVTINYQEQASLVVKADTDEEAREHVLKTFEYIPGIEVVKIEDAPEDTVREAMEALEAQSRSIN